MKRIILFILILLPTAACAELEGYRVEIFGGGPPGFEQPRCVRTGPEGRLWFLEGSNDNVRGRVVDPADGFRTVLRFGVNALSADQPDRWFHPASVRPTALGVFVADTGHRRVLRFNLEGDFAGVAVDRGTGRDALLGPTDALPLDDGRIVVCDAASSRVLLFDKRGRLGRVIASPGAGDEEVDHPYSLALDADGELWIVDTLNHRLVERDAGFAVKRVLRPFDGDVPLFRSISFLDFDADGNLYVADSAASCVLKLSHGGELLARIGMSADGPRPLVGPSGVTLTRSGEALVSDADRNAFARFDRAGRFRDFVGLPYSSKQRVRPIAFAADGDGALYQAWLYPECSVRATAADGTIRQEFGGRGDAPGKFLRPRDVAVGPDGNVYVADTRRHDITVYRPDGVMLDIIGRKGRGEGELLYPRALAFAGETLLVGDAGNRRIERFDLKGNDLGTFATNVDAYRIDVDPAGRVAILDDAAEAIVLFDKSGRRTRRIALAGGVDVSGPVFAGDGRVWLLDRRASRIRAFDAEGQPEDLPADSRLRGARELFRGRDGRARVGYDFGAATLNPDGAIDAFTFAMRTPEPGQLLMPSSLAALGDELAVLSRETASIHVFARDGTFRRMLPLDASVAGAGQIAAVPRGGIAVLCPLQGEIFAITDGRCERVASGGALRMARAFAVDQTGGYLVLADETLRRLDATGRETAALNAREGGLSMRHPSAVAALPSGDILLGDARSGEVACLASDFSVRWRIEQKSLDNRRRMWGGVASTGVDADGKLYVLSKWDNTVQVFDRDRKHLRNIHLGANGVGALRMPEDILVAPDGALTIADTGNNRIVRLIPE